MIRVKKNLISFIACFFLALFGLSGCQAKTGGQNTKSVSIELWHYYNGAQQQIFESLISEFNETVGAEKQITVTARGFGTISGLTEQVLKSFNQKVGSGDVPDIFASYPDTAYELNEAGLLTDLSQYLTEEEQTEYIASYLSEGILDESGEIKIFPVAKSTELLYLNQTAWEPFAEDTGITAEALSTWEGIASVAEEFYHWTDALTPDAEGDGKAFFGRDAFANYMIIGSYQLGTELFHVEDGEVTVQIDESAMRRLWDCFYVPYINGYYTSCGNYRSDDMSAGKLIAYVGSSSAVTYFPSEVAMEDGNVFQAEGAVYSLPDFEGTEPVAVQQGAGMVVTKSTPEREEAAMEFLKWLTKPEQNLRFTLNSGYLPVTYEAGSMDAVNEAAALLNTEYSDLLKDSISIGLESAAQDTFYSCKPFAGGDAAREIVDHSMEDAAISDRAAIEALMAEGVSREDAVAQYHTDERFYAWLVEFRAALEQTVS